MEPVKWPSVGSAALYEPKSPSVDLLETQVITLHKVLYAEAATNLSDACDFIALHFEDDMRYENPLCTVVGSKALMQHLYLLYSLPGTSATSELEDVYHRQERFGTTSFIFTHQITWSLMDLQDRDGSVTPQSTTTINTAFQGSTPPSPTSPFLHARLRPVPSRHDGSTFFSDMFGKLWPPTLLRNLTTLNIKCNTHVHYNEQGKVVLLEDVVSLKDLFESIPVFGKVYALERRALAASVNGLSRWLMSATAHTPDTPVPQPTQDREPEGLNLQLSTDH